MQKGRGEKEKKKGKVPGKKERRGNKQKTKRKMDKIIPKADFNG